MLLCGIDEVETGNIVAASVFHPQRPDVELLATGVALDNRMINRVPSRNSDDTQWRHSRRHVSERRCKS